MSLIYTKLVSGWCFNDYRIPVLEFGSLNNSWNGNNFYSCFSWGNCVLKSLRKLLEVAQPARGMAKVCPVQSVPAYPSCSLMHMVLAHSHVLIVYPAPSLHTPSRVKTGGFRAFTESVVWTGAFPFKKLLCQDSLFYFLLSFFLYFLQIYVYIYFLLF